MDKKRTLEIDKKHIWHPFTQMKDYENIDHVVITHGNGVKIFDADGNEYYDTISSWWTNTHGHAHPSIMKAIEDQLKKLDHINFSGFTHPYAAEVVDEMLKILHPSLSRFFFSDDGSTSVEIAVKMAYQYWRNIGKKDKTKFVHLSNSYHGDTVGGLSVGGLEIYRKHYGGLTFDSIEVSSPQCSNCKRRLSKYTYDAMETGCSLECFDEMENLLLRDHKKIAGVIVEPLILAAAGMQVYPPEYLQKLRALTRDLDIILIYDEVVTGFGRLGTMFAYEKAQAEPDIICFAKGLTGGVLPLALTVTTEKIYEAFYDDYLSYKTFFHGHSYTANPIACVAAAENLRIFQREKLPHSKIEVMERLHNRVKDFGVFDFVGDIRFIGFIGAIDICKKLGKGLDNRQKFSPETRIGLKIYQNSLKKGLVLRPLGDTIYWLLPLAVTKEDIDIIFDRSGEALLETINEARNE